MPEGQLKRELGLRDITLFTITCIVGTRWIAAAAHAGPGSITLWILAAVFFAVPLAIAVTALTLRHPKAGGLYVWTREDFGPWNGFLCFFLYWIGIAIWFPSVAMFYMGAALHALGVPETRPYLLGASLVAIWLALGTNLIGMKIGKWTENIGGLSVWLVSALFVILAALIWMKRGSATVLNPVPEWKWDTVNFWATIAYGMSGVEVIGLMGGEIRNPKRTIPRAGWIASACLAVFYTTATVAVLVLLPPSQISEMSGLAQAGDEAASVLGLRWLGPAVAVLVVASGMGQLGGFGTSVSRLPFAAGADRKQIGRVHAHKPTHFVSLVC